MSIKTIRINVISTLKKAWSRSRSLRLILFVAATTATPAFSEERSATSTVGGRFGSGHGEAYLSIFAPLSESENGLIFLNPRVALKDEGASEGNLGIGFRKLINDDKIIFGANLYADRNRSKYDNDFDQWGFGIELLSESFDFRANYYDPGSSTVIGSTTDIETMSSVTNLSESINTVESTSSRIVSSRTQIENTDFYQDNNIYGESVATTTDRVRTTTNVTQTRTKTFTTDTTFTDLFFEKREGGLEGYDFEVGYKLPLADTLPEVRLFGGYYDFDGPFESEIKGGKGRLEVRAGEYLTFDAEVFEDKELHGSDYYLGARVNLPFSFSNLFSGKNPFLKRKHDMITFRNRGLKDRIAEEVIRDVNIHIAESAFEENVAKRQVALKQDVRQEVDVTETSTSRDRNVVSVDVTTDIYTRDGADITVTHVDNNETSSGDIGTFEDPNTTITTANATQAADANDIVLLHSDGSYSGETANITDNQMLIGQGGGIETTISTDQGDLVLPEANEGSGAVPIINGGGVQIGSNNVTVTNLSIDGGNISTTPGSDHSNLTITNVTVANSVGDAIELGEGGTLSGNITLENITITDSGVNGIDINNAQGNAVVSGTNINISGAGDDGIDIDDALAGSQFMFTDVTIDDGDSDGINISDSEGSWTFNNINISNSESEAIRIDGSSGSFAFTDTTLSDINSDAIEIDDSSGSFVFTNTTITNADSEGIDIDEVDGTVMFTNTSIDNSGDNGIELEDSTGTVTFNNLTVSNSNNDGVQLEDNDATINFNNADISDSGEDGLQITGSSDAIAFDANSSITNSGEDAVYIEGGDANITYSGTINHTLAGASQVIEVDGVAGGDIVFNSAANNAIVSNAQGIVIIGSSANVNVLADTEIGGGGGLHIVGSDGVYNFADTDIVDVVGFGAGGTGLGAFELFDSDATVTFGVNSSVTQGVDLAAISIVNDGSTLIFDGSINATNGVGADFAFADGSYTFNGNNQFNGGDAGIDVFDSFGTIVFGAGTSITNPTNEAIDINGNFSSPMGSGLDFTYSGSIVNNTDNSVQIRRLAGGTVNINASSITHTGADTGVRIVDNMGVDIDIANLNVSGSGARGINIVDTSGTVDFTGASITNTAGAAFRVSGGTADVGFDGSISQTNSGDAVRIAGRAGGSVEFAATSTVQATGTSGGIRIAGSTGDNTVNFAGNVDLGSTMSPLTGNTAVSVNNNGTNSTVSFANLNINTDGTRGLHAQNGGNINVTNGSITSTGTSAGDGRRALDLNGVNANINLASVSSTNSSRQGIEMDAVSGSVTIGTVSINGSGSAGVDIRDSSANVSFTGAVGVNNAGANGLDLRNNSGQINFGGTVTVNDAANDGINLRSNTGQVNFNGVTNVARAGDAGINLRNNASGVVNFGTTNIALSTAAGATGVDYDGNNNGSATFGATSITGVGSGANQVGINLNGVRLVGQQSYTSVDISGDNTSTDSIAVDLTGVRGNQNVHLGEQVRAGASSHINDVHRGVVIDNTAAVQFVFGDGESATDTGSTINVNGLAGSFTVDAGGGTLAASNFNFEDVVVGAGDVANLPAAANLPVFVSTAGGVVNAGVNNLVISGGGTSVNTISVAAALGQANTGQNFVFVGDGMGSLDVVGGGAAGFTLLAGQAITSFDNGNVIFSGSAQPANISGNIGASGTSYTSDNVIVSNTDAGATSVISATSAGGNNQISNVSILSPAAATAAIVIGGAAGTPDPITIANVSIDNGTGIGVSLQGNTQDVTLNNVDLVDLNMSGVNTGTALSVTGANHAGQITVGSGSDLGNTTGTVLSANVTDNILNIDMSAAGITTANNTQNVVNIAGLAAGSNVQLGNITADGVTADSVVNVDNMSGGTLTLRNVDITNFGDSISDTAVDIAGTGGAVNATELNLSTTTGNALAMDAQTLALSSVNSQISTGAGQAINLENTIIGAGGVTFAQVTTGAATSADSVSIENATGGDITLTSVNLNGAAGSTGLDITGDTRTSNVVVSGGTINSGVRIQGSGSGAVTIEASVTDSAGYAVQVANRGVGAGDVNFNGAVSSNTGTVSIANNAAGDVNFNSTVAGTGSNSSGAINVFANSGGAITFADQVTLNMAGSGLGVNIQNSNAGATLDFNGGLDIATVNGTGFNAQSGTIGVANAGTESVVATGTAGAINIESATVAAGGITFDQVTTAASATSTGVNIENATGGDITLTSVNLNGAAGSTGLDIAGDTRTSNVVVSGGTINSGVRIQGSGSGTVTIEASVTDNTGYAVQVANRGVGAGDVNFNGAVSSNTGTVSIANNAAGDVNFNSTVAGTGSNSSGAINVFANSGGAITFADQVTLNMAGSGLGVNIQNSNAGATLDFNGGLDIATVNGTGFNAQSGTIGVANAGTESVVVTGTAGAINIESATVAAGGITFDQVTTAASATNTGVNIENAAGGDITLTSVNLNGVAGTTGLGIAGATRTSNVVVSGGTINSGISISGSGSGTVMVGANIADNAGHAVQISNRGAGAGQIDINGTVTNSTGAVSIQNNSDGIVNFNGVVTGTGSNSAGSINLDGNTGGTTNFTALVDLDLTGNGVGVDIGSTNTAGMAVNFNGGLDINSVNGIGFNAEGGTVNVAATAGNETITTTGGSAVNMSQVGGNVNFDSITANGGGTALDGIHLEQLAANTSFSVSGVTTLDNFTGEGIQISSIANDNVTISFGATDINRTVSANSTTTNAINIFGNSGDNIDIDFGAIRVGQSSTTTAVGILIGNDTATSSSIDFASVETNNARYGIRIENVDGATVGVTGNTNLQNADLALLDIRGSTSNVSFGGTVTTQNSAGFNSDHIRLGTGMVNTGTVTFTGQVTSTNVGGANGTGLNMSNGPVNFNGGLDINTGAGDGISTTGGTLNIANAGTTSVSTTSGTALSLTNTAGNINLATVTSTALAGADGVVIDGLGAGSVNLGTVSLTGGGVDISGTNTGSISFTDLDVALTGDNQTAFDMNGAVVNGNVTAGDFDVTSTSLVGTTGVDLAGTTGTGVIQLGDTTIDGGASSSIVGTASGVNVSATTNVNFTFGDGDGTTTGANDGTASIITATNLITGTLPAAGTYDFEDVNVTTSGIANLSGADVYYVDQAGSGDGSSQTMAGSISGAEASGADVIIIIDSVAGAGGDLIDLSMGTHLGVDANTGSLNLDDNQILLGLVAGQVIDLSTYGLSGGAPMNFLFTGLSSSSMITGIATLDTSVATIQAGGTADTIILAGSTAIADLSITNLGTGTGVLGNFAGSETVTIMSSTVAGISIAPTGGTTTVNLNGVSSTSTVNLNGSGAGTVILNATGTNTVATTTDQILNFDTVTLGAGGANFASLSSSGSVTTGNAINLESVTGGAFNGGNVTVAGTTAGDGVHISNTTSSTSFASMNIGNTSGNGIEITATADGGNSGNFSVSGLTDINTTGAGQAGIQIGNMAGSVTFANVNINNRGGAGIAINGFNDGQQDINFGAVTINNQNASNTTALAIDNINGASSTVDIASVAINGGGSNSSGIALSNNDGATININGGSVSNAGGVAVSISSSAGSATYAGTINNTAGGSVQVVNNEAGSSTVLSGSITDTGAGVNISNNVNSSITLSGASVALNTGTNDAVTLSNNAGSTINFTNGGLDIDTTSGAGFTAINGGVFNVSGSGNTINTVSGTALRLQGGTISGNVVFDSVSASALMGTTFGMVIGNYNGTLAVNGGSLVNTGTVAAVEITGGVGANITLANTINSSGGTGRAIDISALSGSTVVISGNFIDNNATGGGISVYENGSSNITFSGTSTQVNTGVMNGVVIHNNDASTINFTNGGLDIDTTTGAGFTATPGFSPASTITVQGAGNTVATTTGTAVNIVGTTIGAAGVTFQSVSADGAVNGIVLDTTGGGGFTITGDGTSTRNSSGGTIQNTTGSAILLTNASNIEINHLNITDADIHAVDGTGVVNFTMRHGTISGVGAAAADDHNAINFVTGAQSVTGTVLIDNMAFTNFEDTGIDILNSAGAVTVTVSNSDFSTNHATFGNEAIAVESQGTASFNLNVTDNTFLNLQGDAVGARVGGSGATHDINITGNNSTNNLNVGGGDFLVHMTNGADITFDISNNVVDHASMLLSGDPIQIVGNGNAEGRIVGNTLSGYGGDAIRLDMGGSTAASAGNITWTVLIDDNDIGVAGNAGLSSSASADEGIDILSRDHDGTLNVTINNNRIHNPLSRAINLFSDDDSPSAGGPTNNISITNNLFTGVPGDSIRIRSTDTNPTTTCANIVGNTGTGGIFLDEDTTPTGSSISITQASLAALNAANTGLTANQNDGAIGFGGGCGSVVLPMNP